MADMTKRERVQAALAGKAVDRPPVAFWRHWPIDDQQPESLASRALDYQRRFDFDFIKAPPSHTYCYEDWGAKHMYRGKPSGDRDDLEFVIKRPEDWDRIEPVDVHRGSYGRALQCLRIILERRDPDVPVIYTLFDPLNMARYLSGDITFITHLRRHPERFERALAALTETCASFARAVVQEGGDGIFLSVHTASYEVMSEEEFRRLGRPSDLRVLQAAEKGWFNMLHVHGQHPMMGQVVDYPAQAINWHDRSAGPSLAEVAKVFPGAVVGGVEQYNLLHFGMPAEVETQVHDAVRQLGGRRLIVGAGCTYPLTVPEGNLIAARRATETAPHA
ncbi:MAG: uroporphyrinogen decarboxylase [Chloroflexi bacterium]|nr:uroporphyrinogen decarboxylase [Chloroflexota bacterium]